MVVVVIEVVRIGWGGGGGDRGGENRVGWW